MRKRLTMVVIGCGYCLAILAGSVSEADDWPEWRGPTRDGSLAGFHAPKVWPKQLSRQWQVEVGQGHASPVVVGDRVFLISREGEEEVVRAVNLADGRQQWSESYSAPYKMNSAARSHGKGPKSTPVAADGRLTTLGISGILSCWDTGSGKLLWQHNFSGQFNKTSPLFGTAMSPVVEQGLLIAHVGGHNQGALTAFDARTGEPKWRWDGDGPAYTSPIVARLGSARRLITQSQNACIMVSPSNGSLLWKMPFTTRYTMNIVTPVVLGDLVVFSGYQKGTTAYRLSKSGDKWASEDVWHNAEVSMFMSSPVVVDGRLFGLSERNKGQFFCLDISTGKTLWTSEGRMGENAAIVKAPGAILALTTNAELIAFEPDADRFELLARYKVADTPIWAHPVVLGKRILVKDRSSLALWTFGR